MAENRPQQPISAIEQEIKNRIQEQTSQEPIINPPAMTLYANHFGLGMTVFDLALLFGEAIGVQDGRPVIQQRIKVLLSPLLAKIVARSLAEGVAQYEKQFGEIKDYGEVAGAFVEK
jgi:Protein of unknown function (DUF3467)